jgi:hypothetical protein
LGLAVAGPAAAASASTLRAYADEAEFTAALERWRLRAAELQPRRRTEQSQAMAEAAPAPMASNMAAAGALAKSAADSAGESRASESITNVQTAGVDEGGIVKRAGDHLLILRRGRLFTVRVGGDALAPVATVDAYAPGSDPQGAWYDELLVSGSTVVVVGYSYARGGTEIGLFDLAADGQLSYRATWHLRSFDYYSSRNYASRLVGNKLVFYAPSTLQPWQRGTVDSMPALRRWHTRATPGGFKRILPATRVYRTDDDFDPTQPLALHTVTACDLSQRELQCESSAVLGPMGRVFYVSTGSVYVWTSSIPRRHWVPVRPMLVPAQERSLSAVFRLPLDGAAPTALKTAGVPIDQMSFLEDSGGHLNVLLRDSGAGEGMWGSERAQGGAMALLRVPLAQFGDGRQAAGRAHYRALPPAPAGAVQNRFIGDWLVWGGTAASRAWATRYAWRDEPLSLDPGHAIERIEALGSHALLVGNRGADLHMNALRLADHRAEIAGEFVQQGARQGETRTHGFFYRPTGDDEGLLGLPILQPSAGARHGVYARGEGSAAVMFVRQRDLAFTSLGGLQAQGNAQVDDGCKASCVDWYGNARPIFIGRRIFALMGYELVEGRLDGGLWRERLEERRRVSFAPDAAREGARHWPFQ